MFKHLRDSGLDSPSGSVEGSPPSTDEDRQAWPVLHYQHAQGGPAKLKPTAKGADIEDDNFSRVVIPQVEPTQGVGEDAAMSALSTHANEDAMTFARAKHDSKVDVGEVYSPPRVFAEARAAGMMGIVRLNANEWCQLNATDGYRLDGNARGQSRIHFKK